MPPRVRQEDIPALLRVTGFHSRDFALSVIRSPPDEHDAIRQSIGSYFPSLDSSLGDLEALPVEVVSLICMHLDILSCFQFRHVNKACRRLLSTAPIYTPVVTHGLEAFRAMLRTRLAKYFTLVDLYTALCTMDCSFCGSFGGFIFLPTATRCCFRCIDVTDAMRLISAVAASEATGIKASNLKRTLRLFRSLPGFYSLDENLRKRSMWVVSVDEAMKKIRPVSRARKLQSALSDRRNAEKILPYMACTVLPYLDRAMGEVEYGISCKACQMAVEARMEYEHPADVETSYDIFSTASFLQHFESCRKAQKLWRSSARGTVEIEETELIKRRGYMDEVDDQGRPT